MARACRLPSDAEVETLRAACDEVARQTRAAYPTVHVQLKIHVIESHLKSFVRRWRTVGLFTEDACESIHALVSQLDRRFACLHGVSKSESKAAALEILARKDLQALADARRTRRARGPYRQRRRPPS